MSATTPKPTMVVRSLSSVHWPPLPGWAAVALSRVLALVAGVIGATCFSRVAGWSAWDPQRLSQHLGAVGDALAGSAVRWDSIHYLEIAHAGYAHRGQTVFFPLYPLLIRVLGTVVRSDVIAGVVISLVAFAAALVLLHRLTVEELGTPAAGAAVVLLAFAPMSFFFSAVYTESLFLALSLGAFHLARRQRWLGASLCGAAAALTRLPGVLLLAPLGLMYLDSVGIGIGRPPRGTRLRPAESRLQRAGPRLRGGAPLLLIPLALAAFLLYLDHHGYGLLAPIVNQETLHEHAAAGPISTLVAGVRDGLTGIWQTVGGAGTVALAAASPFAASFENAAELVVLVISVAALTGVFRRLPLAYGIYAALVLVLCVWSSSPLIPMLSLDRYVLVIFPLWMVAGDWLARRRLVVPVALLGATLMVFYAISFARWAYVA